MIELNQECETDNTVDCVKTANINIEVLHSKLETNKDPGLVDFFKL